MICANCWEYLGGKCWSKRSGQYGNQVQPEGSCKAFTPWEYDKDGVPVQLWTEKEKACDPLRNQQRDPRVLD